jgi:hypothetical protein
MATLALFWPFLDERFRGRALRGAAWIIAAVFVFEVGHIAFRASLAEASHFNRSTPAADALYAAMGVGIVIVMAITAWIGIRILRSSAGGLSPALRLAIGGGLVLGSVLATLSGGYMSQQDGHWVGGAATDADGILFFGWSRSGGDLRAAHFFGLHAMQGLPVVGWLVQRASAGRIVVTGLALIWAAITAAVFIQALQGHPLLPL